MGLRLIFLIVTRAVSVLGLSRREAWWNAEILMLRPDQVQAHADALRMDFG